MSLRMANYGVLVAFGVVVLTVCFPNVLFYHVSTVTVKLENGHLRNPGCRTLLACGHNTSNQGRKQVFPSHDEDPIITFSSPRLLQGNESQMNPLVSDTVTTQTIPAVLLGIASFLLICSLIQYAHEWRHCCLGTRNAREAGKVQEQQPAEPDTPKEKEGSSATVTAKTSNECSTENQDIYRSKAVRNSALIDSQQRFRLVPRILPPLRHDDNELEATSYLNPYQESLSRVSTLTTSIVEGAMSFGEFRDEGIQESHDRCQDDSNRETTDVTNRVVELSEQYLVSQERDITMLLKASAGKRCLDPPAPHLGGPPIADCEGISATLYPKGSAGSNEEGQTSSCSNLTEMSAGEEAEEVIGVACLQDDDVTPKKKPRSLSCLSLELSPDTVEINSVGRDIAIVGKLLFQDEHADLCPEDSKDFSMCPAKGKEDSMVAPSPPGDWTRQGKGAIHVDQTQHLDRRDSSSYRLEDIDPVPVEEYIRDIYFVPLSSYGSEGGSSNSKEQSASDSILGLRLSDASCDAGHPSVSKVSATSPLVGRMFEGDFILQVNGTSVAGFTAHEVVTLIHHTEGEDETNGGEDELSSISGSINYHMIKLTIMSSHCDSLSDLAEDETSGVNDVGLTDSCAEL